MHGRGSGRGCGWQGVEVQRGDSEWGGTGLRFYMGKQCSGCKVPLKCPALHCVDLILKYTTKKCFFSNYMRLIFQHYVV